MSKIPALRTFVTLPVVIAALGYFVDIYDLTLFSIARVPSLSDLGFASNELTDKGLMLINLQMTGMLLGGIFWGILGDKKGRISVLFGSILMYSLANFLNGMVQTIEQYAALRLIAGFGLAGELGIGITLVAESLPKELRGYGTMVVAGIGVSGAVLANIVMQVSHDWRTAYYAGGALGLLLLLLRIKIFESCLFEKAKKTNALRGDFLRLFTNRSRFLRYMQSIFLGFIPWYIVGILVTFSPEFAKTFGIPIEHGQEKLIGGNAVMFCYIGLTAGDFASGTLSQFWHSRKKSMLLFFILSAISTATYLFCLNNSTLPILYAVCGFLGFSAGFWAIFVTVAAEQFGTNYRATVATTAPNFARGALVPIALSFEWLKSQTDIVSAAFIAGAACIAISFVAWAYLPETFHKELDYVE
ncbi:MFS transporter [Ignavibacteria bacterium]|nr:MFS transporter [Bacteroidota bacterium]MCZ2132291.1 MFS transporter [Bacteroidota bacterium]